jgi:hypothetical protein
MKRTFLIALGFALIGAAVAHGQSGAACPLQIVKVDSSNGLKTGLLAAMAGAPRSSGWFVVSYRNKSDRTITGVKIGVSYINAVQEVVSTESLVPPEMNLKPNKGRSIVAANGQITSGDPMRAVAWVQKVVFADGSTWEDMGSRACKMASPDSQKRK